MELSIWNCREFEGIDSWRPRSILRHCGLKSPKLGYQVYLTRLTCSEKEKRLPRALKHFGGHAGVALNRFLARFCRFCLSREFCRRRLKAPSQRNREKRRSSGRYRPVLRTLRTMLRLPRSTLTGE